MELLVTSRMPSRWGEYAISAFGAPGDRYPHVVLERGVAAAVAEGKPIPLRVHSECMTGDVFGSRRCDCGEQLHAALAHFKEHGGMLVYLRQEGRGIGLVEKLKAYNLQEEGMNTFDANVALGHGEDERSYGEVGNILAHFGVEVVQLLTNNPAKQAALESLGIRVQERLAVTAASNPDNEAYLKAKREITGHLL